MCKKTAGVGGFYADIPTFVAIASDRHDNAYDYSLVTEDDFKKGKITIICPKHGIFRQLKWDHLKPKVVGVGYMGCRSCGMESRPSNRICKACGKWNKYRNHPYCKECFDEIKAQQSKSSSERFECPQCGKRHGKQRAFCSTQCWKQSVQDNYESTNCVVCGSLFMKRKIRNSKCCGKECANKYNAILGKARLGKARVVNRSWQTRINFGRKAKKKWDLERSKQRRVKSVALEWWRAGLPKTHKSKDDEWMRRCRSGSQGVATRKRSLTGYNRTKCYDNTLSWDDACLAETSRIESRMKKTTKDPWKTKAANWVGNIKHRRYRVNQAKTSSNSEGTVSIS